MAGDGEALRVEFQLDARIAEADDRAGGLGVVGQDGGAGGDDSNTHENPISVRIERSRDAPRDRAVPMGASTSLDTNGKERTRRERECRSGCKPLDRKSTRLNSSH